MGQLVLQRVVFPWDIELPSQMSEVLPLYVSDSGVQREVHGSPPATRPSPPAARPSPRAARPSPRAARVARFTVTGRRSLLIEPQGRASFDSYFNRVHAGYWRRWTRITSTDLVLQGRGRVRVIIKHSTREGREVIDQVHELDLDDGFAATMSLAPFSAGGALWFELEAEDRPVILERAEWVADVGEVRDAVIDVGICTYDRPHDVLALLSTLRSDPELLGHVGTVWLADNGSRSFRDLPGGDMVEALWGSKLAVLDQPNLGGSGGFSRTMFEAVRKREAQYVLLMDDDALPEPESLRRAVIFAEVAKRPIAVGGHMLLRQKPTTVHVTAERVNTKTLFPQLAPLGHANLRLDEESLDVVAEGAYNGWWACLIPTDVIARVGYSLPFFIKYDDVEYGLRMVRAGVTTVTLPGVATWHESWELKDIELDWSWYFVVRNRMIMGAMLSSDLPESIGRARLRTMVKHTLVHDVIKNIARRSYSSADAANEAMRDFLAGPAVLEEPLDELVARVRRNRTRYPGDKQVDPFTEDTRLPADPTGGLFNKLHIPQALAREYGLPKPLLPLPIPPSLLKKHRADEWDIWSEEVDRGSVVVPKSADYWWGLMDHPRAVVVSMDGSKTVERNRDSAVARKLTREALDLGRQIIRRAPELVRAYGEAHERATSAAAWEKQWNR